MSTYTSILGERELATIVSKFLTSIYFFGTLLPLSCLYFLKDFMNLIVYPFLIKEKSIWPKYLLTITYDLLLAPNSNWILPISVDVQHINKQWLLEQFQGFHLE